MTVPRDEPVVLAEPMENLIRSLRDELLRTTQERDEALRNGALQYAEVQRLCEDVIPKLRAERDEARVFAATCSCWNGSHDAYEGAQADCPIHGAIRAFNEAQAELRDLQELYDQRLDAHRLTEANLTAAEAERDEARAELDDLRAVPPDVLQGRDELALRDQLAAAIRLVDEYRDDRERMRPVVEAATAWAESPFASSDVLVLTDAVVKAVRAYRGSSNG